MKRAAFTALLASLLALAAFVPSASAELNFCPLGSAAEQCKNPRGIAVDNETRRIYVADQGNHRINVFELSPEGDEVDFISAFGWGVLNGAEEFQVCTTLCLTGRSGSGLGQFSNPRQIAVDNIVGSANRHAVYVIDGNRRLQKFTPEPLAPSLDFTVPSGNGECEFSGSSNPIVVGLGGMVYVEDKVEIGAANVAVRIEKFDPDTGACIDETLLDEGAFNVLKQTSLAVDAAGNAYVTPGPSIRKYGPSGGFLQELDGQETRALAISPSGGLFAVQRDSVPLEISSVITQYDTDGLPLVRFGYGAIPFITEGLAIHHSPGGDAFVSTAEDGIKYLALPPDNRPVIVPQPCKADPLGNTKATLNAGASGAINPEGKATTFRFEYISDADFDANVPGAGGSFSGPNEPTSTPESDSIGADFNAHKATAQITNLTPETKYRCRVVATNADGSATGVEGTFTTLDPLEIGATWASEVGTEAATLNATVNPLGIPTTGYFQYVDEASFQESGFANATKAPAGEPIEFGAGEDFKAGSAEVTGLTPGTAYRYRIVATDDRIAPKEIEGPTRSFRTPRVGATGDLPDDRAWELVSPAQKNSAEVAIPRVGGGTFVDAYGRIQAAAGSGEAITYTSWTAFADPDTALGASQYLSKRGAGGWGTENVSPSHFEGEPLVEDNPLHPPYRGFSPDLRWGGAVIAQAIESGERIKNLYLRDNEAGVLHRASAEAPVFAPGESCIDYAGTSADGSRVFFAANASYVGAPVPKEHGFNLYEWSAAEGLQLVSVLPNGNPATPSGNTAFGEGGVGVHCQSDLALVRDVISADGNRAFWTYAPASGATQLLARIGGEETIQLDKKAAGAPGSSGGGAFRAASADGSLVFFTAESKLTKDSGATTGAPDLYRYDLGAEEDPLTNLTPDGLTPEAEPAGVGGVVGTSEDGSHVYFIASGVLTEEPNEAGQTAQPGAGNLYLHHEGQVSFIATGPDSAASSQPKSLRSRVSPDGRHLAFLSQNTESLVGYDNAIAEGEHCQVDPIDGDAPLSGSPLCLQAFLYDAQSGELRCASCNPSGSRPEGPSILPAYSNPLEGPRFLSDEGSRLFFESFDALLPQDENGKRDVYEFELPGTGSCTEESPSFDSTSGGCHYLISSGKSTDQTFLLDASSDGRDVFFATRSRLVGWDTDDNYDVYDARAGGGFPEPKEPEVCAGEGCKPPPPPPPPTGPSPGSASFQGPGNVKEGRPPCRKGKVRRRGRCVKPRQRGARRNGKNRARR